MKIIKHFDNEINYLFRIFLKDKYKLIYKNDSFVLRWVNGNIVLIDKNIKEWDFLRKYGIKNV